MYCQLGDFIRRRKGREKYGWGKQYPVDVKQYPVDVVQREVWDTNGWIFDPDGDNGACESKLKEMAGDLELGLKDRRVQAPPPGSVSVRSKIE